MPESNSQQEIHEEVGQDLLLEWHRQLVATPSVSGNEAAIVELTKQLLTASSSDAEVTVLERNIIATKGRGKGCCLLLNSHLDTVPPGEQWTRDPWQVSVEQGRIYGLGSNDAKASVAAMMAAFAGAQDVEGKLVLTLVCDEETGGRGSEIVKPYLEASGLMPDAAVIGEPTSLELAVAQKGLLVLELIAEANSCHSANAAQLGIINPIDVIAADLVALRNLKLGPIDPHLGETTLQPTLMNAGNIRNRTPERATCTLDLRTTPQPGHDALIETIDEVTSSEIRVISKRLGPCSSALESDIVQAAKKTRPTAKPYGSATMSDMVWFQDIPAIKCGPGQSHRSHTPDEFVLASEVIEGFHFYQALVANYFAREGSEA